MKSRSIAVLIALCSSLATEQGLAEKHTAQRGSSPNIVIIYSDDHGYTDLGIHGIDANVDTPNMDALARGGALKKS